MSKPSYSVRNPKPKKPSGVIDPVIIPALPDGASGLEKMDHLSERAVVRLEEMGVASSLRLWLTIAMFALPVLAGLPKVQDRFLDGWRAIAGYLFVFGVVTLCASQLQRHRSAGKQRREERDHDKVIREIAESSNSLGGALQTLTEMLRTGDRTISEHEAHGVCVALLARIRTTYMALAKPDPRVRFRVTLAVPISKAGMPANQGMPAWEEGAADCLRVWCYDQTHAGRKWTALGLGSPGAGGAYQSGELQYIPDIWKVRDDPAGRSRPFRCVVSIPVAGGPDGRSLAVVNIDASERDHFDFPFVAVRVHPMILPGVQAIGLALRVRKEGEPYVFGK